MASQIFCIDTLFCFLDPSKSLEQEYKTKHCTKNQPQKKSNIGSKWRMHFVITRGDRILQQLLSTEFLAFFDRD